MTLGDDDDTVAAPVVNDDAVASICRTFWVVLNDPYNFQFSPKFSAFTEKQKEKFLDTDRMSS